MSYQDQMALLQEKRRELRALEAQAERTAKAMQPITIEDETKMVAAQARADEAYRAAGRIGAPTAMNFERPEGYERRLIEGIASHSPTWARADFSKMPDNVFQIARDQVLAEVAANAKPYGLGPKEIREKPGQSHAGHRTIDFVGGPEAHFIRAFERPARRAQFQEPEAYTRMMQTSQMARVADVVRTMRPPMQAPRAGF
jgi:hypothetical protein